MSGTIAPAPAAILLEVGTKPPATDVPLAPQGMPGNQKPGTMEEEATAANVAVVLHYSDVGWTGEPDDPDMPNQPFPPRITGLPTIGRSIRLMPEESARVSFQSGEVTLDNRDGALDLLGGEWSMEGQLVSLWRGPHRKPRKALFGEFTRIGVFRVDSAPLGTSSIRITVRDAASDLTGTLGATFQGTGGLEGPDTLSGQPKPVVVGSKANVPLVALYASMGTYLLSGASLSTIYAVRDRGVNVPIAAVYPNSAALLAASIPVGQCATCPNEGLVRIVGFTPSVGTADAVGIGGTTHAQCFQRILDLAGVTSERIDAAAIAAAWPGGEAGFLFNGETVASALEKVAQSIGGWWGSNRAGLITAGRIPIPEQVAPVLTLEKWMIDEAIKLRGAAPEEIAGAAPRYRQRINYNVLGRTQSGTDLTGALGDSQEQRDYYEKGFQTAYRYDGGVQLRYPKAADPDPLETGFKSRVDADALAAYFMACHSVRRRRWRVPVGRWGHLITLGQPIAIDWGFLAGKVWIPYASSEQGDNNEISVWG